MSTGSVLFTVNDVTNHDFLLFILKGNKHKKTSNVCSKKRGKEQKIPVIEQKQL